MLHDSGKKPFLLSIPSVTLLKPVRLTILFSPPSYPGCEELLKEPILHIQKLRFRENKELTQKHTDRARKGLKNLPCGRRVASRPGGPGLRRHCGYWTFTKQDRHVSVWHLSTFFADVKPDPGQDGGEDVFGEGKEGYYWGGVVIKIRIDPDGGSECTCLDLEPIYPTLSQ